MIIEESSNLICQAIVNSGIALVAETEGDGDGDGDDDGGADDDGGPDSDGDADVNGDGDADVDTGPEMEVKSGPEPGVTILTLQSPEAEGHHVNDIQLSEECVKMEEDCVLSSGVREIKSTACFQHSAFISLGLRSRLVQKYMLEYFSLYFCMC